MNSKDIRKKLLAFFKERGHTVVPSSSLLPDDPSVLLTTAGMQQFKKYFTGELDAKHDFGSKSTASVQKCFRTSDIDEVGDERHLTFFEMLGNFSFGGYFKKGAIQYGYDFIVKEMGLKIDYVTVFEGEKNVPADEESEQIWKAIDPKIVVKRFGKLDNFWGPTGAEGPCGPTTEIYVDGIEVWNIVFNEYYQDAKGELSKLKTPGVDTGMGLERLAMVVQKKKNIFETDLFQPIIKAISDTDREKQGVISDHVRGSVFLIVDGIVPSNKDRGYILRRLIRRVTHLENSLIPIAEAVIENYSDAYSELKKERENILKVIKTEENTFRKTLSLGLEQFKKGVDPFILHTTYGFPIDLTKDLAKKEGRRIDEKDFEEKFKKHQEISRAGNTGKFGGHGLYLKTGEVTVKDKSELEKVTRLHTATHLMHAALREVLGPEVKQNGSDITVERTRFDFMFPRKLTDEELKKVESLVNAQVKKDLPVACVEMPKAEAEKTGALFFFKERYPEKVKVYYMGKTLADAFSKEFCGGPHVTHTVEVGEFKIVKQEAVGAGMRRIRGVITP